MGGIHKEMASLAHGNLESKPAVRGPVRCMGWSCLYITVVYLGLFVGLLSMREGDVPNTLTGSCEPVPYSGLSWPA